MHISLQFLKIPKISQSIFAISIQVLQVFANANRQEKQIKAKQIRSNKNIILSRSYYFFIWKVQKNLQIHMRRDFGRLLNQSSTYKNEMRGGAKMAEE